MNHLPGSQKVINEIKRAEAAQKNEQLKAQRLRDRLLELHDRANEVADALLSHEGEHGYTVQWFADWRKDVAKELGVRKKYYKRLYTKELKS